MSKPTISLNFMPAFYHKHTGITYGEAYYFDPAYRAEVERVEGRFLYEVLGRYGVGSREPQPSPGLAIQPVDLLKLTQGALLQCPDDATLETRGTPWAALSVAEIAALDPRDAAHSDIVERLLRQYGELQRLYGDEADIFGLKGGVFAIHAPYTSGHQLVGESLFMLMLDDPAGAQVIFDKIWAIYQAVFGRLLAATGGRPTHLHLGDCSAAMLSGALYRDVVLPANQKLAAQFTSLSYHSCGASSHLLDAFAHLPALRGIELGPGTDLAHAVALMPGAQMRPLIDPLLVRNDNPAGVANNIIEILTATSPAPDTVLCAWSFDRETPLANVAAMYETVQRWR